MNGKTELSRLYEKGGVSMNTYAVIYEINGVKKVVLCTSFKIAVDTYRNLCEMYGPLVLLAHVVAGYGEAI